MLEECLEQVRELSPIKSVGHVISSRGLVIKSHGPVGVMVGERCLIERGQMQSIDCEVVAVDGEIASLMPYNEQRGVSVGDRVVAQGSLMSIEVSDALIGRVISPSGEPLDGKARVHSSQSVSIVPPPFPAMERPPIKKMLTTGVRAIDALAPLGQGQRIGIFAGSGVGKSTLLSMIAKNSEAELIVIALIGERAREVQEFLQFSLGEEGRARSIVVVSTSSSPALSRTRGAYAASALARHFAEEGKNVMLLFDSVTRFALAQREIGLTVGEPPATKGFPPSVFAELPRLLEISGTYPHGSVTGIYTVLVEGGDMDEPISDSVRGILDGHIILSRALAERGHYPSIDAVRSLSRLASRLLPPEQRQAATAVKKLLAVYEEKEDLIAVGAYAAGSSVEVDLSIRLLPRINTILEQESSEPEKLDEARQELLALLGEYEAAIDG